MGSSYHFCRDCIWYETIEKIPNPLPGHPNALRIKCNANGDNKSNGGLYYCDDDFEKIRKTCPAWKPLQQSWNYIAEQ